MRAPAALPAGSRSQSHSTIRCEPRARFTVSAGALTMYDGEDRACHPHRFAAGMGSIEAGTTGHVHLLRNEGTSVAETLVTFLLPVGAPIRTDLAAPAHCPA